jgi:hypothetical protein
MASYRSSKWFIQLTVGMAVFTDIFLYALVVPVMPYALTSRTHIKEEESKHHSRICIHSSNLINLSVQQWLSILIAVYGGALAIFSRKST